MMMMMSMMMMREENEDEDQSVTTYQNAGIVNLKKCCIRKLLSLIQKKKHKKLQHVLLEY